MALPESHLPSITAIRAFVRVARHLNMTRAAEELNLSQSAVSQHIRALEATLGVDLFRRVGRRLILTEPGQRYAVHGNRILDLIIEASEDMIGFHHCGNLTISVSNAFAYRWLMPRIGRFCERFPEINLRFSTSDGPVEFGAQDVNLAIRYGGCEWGGRNAAPFLSETIFPVCSPALRAKLGKLSSPADLLQAPLLIDSSAAKSAGWEAWLKRMGVPAPRRLQGVSFQDVTMMLSAAAAGHGVALARGALVADDLEAGFFVRLFDAKVELDRRYWIMLPETSSSLTKPEKFKQWLLNEAALQVGKTSSDAVRLPAVGPTIIPAYDHQIEKRRAFQL